MTFAVSPVFIRALLFRIATTDLISRYTQNRCCGASPQMSETGFSRQLPHFRVSEMAALLDFFPQQRSQNKSQLVTNNLYPKFVNAENVHSAHHTAVEST